MLDRWIGCVSLACLLVAPRLLFGAETPVPEQAVAKRSFEITVAPRDTASADARAADLFVSAKPGAAWKFAGPCSVVRTNTGPFFTRRFDAPADGVYYFTSRAGDAAGMGKAPAPGDRPQVKVLVDTQAPTIELTAPLEGETVRPAQTVELRWRADDEHLGARPVRILWSGDRGRNWQIAAADLTPDGAHTWTVPTQDERRLLLKAVVVDRAGNAAEVMRALKLDAVLDRGPQPTAETKETVQPAPAVTVDAGDFDPGLDDPRRPTRYPKLDANAHIPEVDKQDDGGLRPVRSNRAAWIAFVMAGNLVKQGRLKDALRYYRTAVDADPDFDEAWSDMALVYKQLGDHKTATECILRALEADEDEPVYHHNHGAILQSAGLSQKHLAVSYQERDKAAAAVEEAVKAYNQALKLAHDQGRLPERAATYFRLGEICYYANGDVAGAKKYWQKVLQLHTPTPDLDLVRQDEGTPAYDRSLRIYRRHTELKQRLEAWQAWARSYLQELAAMERQGLLQPAPGEDEYLREAEGPAGGVAPQRPAPTGQYQRGRGAWTGAGYGSQLGSEANHHPALPPLRRTAPNAAERRLLVWPRGKKRGMQNAPRDSGYWGYSRRK